MPKTTDCPATTRARPRPSRPPLAPRRPPRPAGRRRGGRPGRRVPVPERLQRVGQLRRREPVERVLRRRHVVVEAEDADRAARLLERLVRAAHGPLLRVARDLLGADGVGAAARRLERVRELSRVRRVARDGYRGEGADHPEAARKTRHVLIIHLAVDRAPVHFHALLRPREAADRRRLELRGAQEQLDDGLILISFLVLDPDAAALRLAEALQRGEGGAQAREGDEQPRSRHGCW